MKTDKSMTILTGINNETLLFCALWSWRKLHESDRNNIREYRHYRKGIISLSSDDANSLQMEIISELAELILEARLGISRNDMYNENGSYHEKYQDMFSGLYDDIEDRLLNIDFNCVKAIEINNLNR